MTTVNETYGLDVSELLLNPDKGMFIGTEYEIENVKGLYSASGDAVSCNSEVYWFWPKKLGVLSDHSLRNSGIEIITAPADFESSLELFDLVHSSKVILLGPEPYSERTSIHTHINVSWFTLAQVKHFTLLYALFEPIFFSLVDPKRKYNIHCVPLSFTLLPKYYQTYGGDELIGCWSKYTALNLLPVKVHGSVEFRHQHGHGDRELYKKWLTHVRAIWNIAAYESELWLATRLKKGLSTNELAAQVFGNPYNNLDFSTSTIDVKLAYI